MKKIYVPRRGDFIRVDFARLGHEQSGRRPALVLSPLEYNRKMGLAVVCPVTSASKDFAWEVPIIGSEPMHGVVLADQIKSIAWRERHAEFVSMATWELLDEVIERVVALLTPDEDD